MKSPKKAAKGVKGFIGEVSLEMKKSTWPTRQELMESTVVVIVSITILGLFVGATDWLMIRLLDMIHNMG
jgi:preprotein translocase subunit SecE